MGTPLSSSPFSLCYIVSEPSTDSPHPHASYVCDTDYSIVLIALLAFVNLVPAALSLEATRSLLVRLKLSHVLPNVMRWVDIIWLYIMSPLALLVLLFGSLTGGNATHFGSVHGVSLLPQCTLDYTCRHLLTL